MTQRLYCNGGCADSYHEDRRQGLFYSATFFTSPKAHATAHKRSYHHWHQRHYEEDGIMLNHSEATAVMRRCRYCQASIT